MLQLIEQWKRRRLEVRLAKQDARALVERYGERAPAEASRRANTSRWQESRDNLRRPGHWSRVRGEVLKQLTGRP